MRRARSGVETATGTPPGERDAVGREPSAPDACPTLPPNADLEAVRASARELARAAWQGYAAFLGMAGAPGDEVLLAQKKHAEHARRLEAEIAATFAHRMGRSVGPVQ